MSNPILISELQALVKGEMMTESTAKKAEIFILNSDLSDNQRKDLIEIFKILAVESIIRKK